MTIPPDSNVKEAVQMKNILVVDDEKSIRKLLSRYLKEADYNCWTARDVVQAKQILQLNPIDLVLSDINMPGESGIDLTRYIKDEFPEIGIVIVSIIDNPIVAKEALALDLYGYIVKPFTRNLVLITVENAIRRRRLELQSQAQQKALESKVRSQSSRIHVSEEKYRQIVDNIGIGVALLNQQLEIIQMNPQMREWFPDVDENLGLICHKCFQKPARESPCENCPVIRSFADGGSFEAVIQIKSETGDRYFRDHSSPLFDEQGNIIAAILLVEEVTEKMTLEQELRQAQKLEAIGQLAAGIAHEINTPIQYIGDNTEFLQDSFGDLGTALSAYDKLLQAVKKQSISQELIESVETSIEEADISYLNEEIPRAIEQSLEGVKRVSEIVRAMRDFSHPGSDKKSPVNLNQAIENTIIVARNEWKYVAEMELNLDPSLPEVLCLPGEINQVLLNVIINAAHAIADTLEEGSVLKGTISISTRRETDWAVIHISDTGTGIPVHIQHRIFDPFFTTKEVGHGTGQGLAIAHSVIVDKHGGNFRFQTEKDKGTTFLIELPLMDKQQTVFHDN